MILTVRDTSLLNKAYVSRGLITHGAVTHNLIRTSDDVLWAGVRTRHLQGQINLLRSDDGGFSWSNVFRGTWPTGLGWGGETPIRNTERANGPFISLTMFEELDKIILWHSFHHEGANSIRVWPFIFKASTGQRDLDEVPSNNTGYHIGADELAVKVAHNENMLYMVYTSSLRLRVRTFFPNRITQPRTDSIGPDSGVSATFDAKARANGVVDIVYVTNSEALRYLRYNDLQQDFSNPVTIAQPTSRTIRDVTISRDGNGTLLAVWTEIAGSSTFPRYATSVNNGASWQANNITTTGTYIDKVTNQPAGRTNSIAGLNGFLVSYVESDGSRPQTVVRTLLGNQLGEKREIGRRSHPDAAIVGAKFFVPPVSKLLDLEDPGAARVAYQVGEGNSSLGVDTEPVRFAQEPLSQTAYPTIQPPLPPPVDVPQDAERLVTVRVIAGPSSSIDYYKEGVIGRHTRRHEAAFRRVGTDTRFMRYDPTPEAETNDRAAYGKPTEFVSKAVVSAMSYEFPFENTMEAFTTFVERDARRIHFMPDMYLEREFLLNKGNFLKRTVWTYYFDGNEYEISQVVPHFMGGQLTHYSANSYVVGVSNNPFSRKILPSET